MKKKSEDSPLKNSNADLHRHPEKCDQPIPAEVLCETILNSANFGIIATDCQGYVLFINPFARSLLNFHQNLSNRAVRIHDIDKDLWKEYRTIIETGEPQINVPAEQMGPLW